MFNFKNSYYLVIKNYCVKIIKMEFNNLYKDSSLKLIISNDIKESMLNHAYLLCGQDEVYLNYLAKQFAKQVLCESEGCNNCSTCLKVEKAVHSDVLFFPKDSKKGLVVDDINEIVEKAYIYPLEASKKIFVINNFDLSTVQAQNKLLKTLEEPPKTSMFILTSTNPANILNTIKSRSKSINIPLLSDLQVENFILKNSTLKPRDVKTYVSSAQGNLTKALKIVNDADFIKIKELCFNTVLKLNGSGEILRYSSKIAEYKDRVNEIFDEISLIMLDVLYVKTGITDRVINKDKIDDYQKSGFSIKALKLIHSKILDSQNKLKSNCNINAVIDGFLINMLEVKHKWK